MRRRLWIFAVLRILPTLVVFTWVRIIPIGEIIRLSFHRWDILSKHKPFIGFENYRELFSDSLFLTALQNTTIIAFGVLVVTLPLAMVLATLIFYRTRSRFAAFYETSIFIPHIVSLVPAAMAWKWIFDAQLGPLNAFLGIFGIEPKAWLFDPVLSVICVIVLVSWQALGYSVLIYLVGLRNLPRSLYEAAALDGATPLQSFRLITIPLLKPITLYVSVVTLVVGFNVYAQVFVLASDAQGAPGRLVRVLVLDMIENSFRNFRVGYAASEAVILLTIVLVLTLIQFSLLRDRSR